MTNYHYLINFVVYTLAMIGFIVLMLIVYKKSLFMPQMKNSKNFLRVETSLKLSATKTIYIIGAGTERFIIAGDNTNTTMLAKLENTNIPSDEFDKNSIGNNANKSEIISNSER